MQPKFSFLSTASNVNLKPGSLLKWNKRLVKGESLLLPLIKVMKIVRLTSLLLDMPGLSSPNPRLGCGRQLSDLSLLNLTLKFGYSFLCFVAGSSFFYFSSTLFLSQEVGFGFCRLPAIPLFRFPAKDLA